MNREVFFLNKILKPVITAYLLSITIHIWNFSYVRFSELIFIILIILIFYGIQKKYIKINFKKIDLPPILLLFSSIFLITFNYFNKEYLLSFFFCIYMFLIYFIFRNILNYYNYKFFCKIILFSIFISSIFGIIGWALTQFNIENIFATNYYYPIAIGKSARANGLFTTPSMLAIHIIICLLILLSINKKENKLFIIYKIIFFISLFLTFSKSIVILLSIYMFYLSKKIIVMKKLFVTLFFMLIFLQTFLVNIIIISKHNNRWLNDSYIPINSLPIIDFFNFQFYLSNYAFLKLKSIEIIRQIFPNGIGFRNFNNYESVNYYFIDHFYPHSTYLGILSEYGILGFISILIFFIYLFKKSKKYFEKKNVIFLYLIIIFFLIESINTDIMSFKIFWVISAIIINQNQKKYN
jgi:hypothetical protein